MANQHLLLFAVGPVQSFITQARKSQDLFAGSQILSDITRDAILYTAMNGHEIIFPYIDPQAIIKLKKLPGEINAYENPTPNRFVALLHIDKADVASAYCISFAAQIRARFIQTADKLLKDAGLDPSGNGMREQLADFPDIHWAAIPFNPDSDDYAGKYKQLEAYFNAVKSIREFSQSYEKGRKCNLNGQYNVKVYRKTIEEQLQRKDPEIKSKKLFAGNNTIFGTNDFSKLKLKHLQPGEGLCAVSLLKRLYKDEKGFPSTARISLLHLFENKSLSSDLDRYGALFKEFTYDEQLLYPENLTEKYFDKYGIELAKDEKLDKVVAAQKTLEAKIRKTKDKDGKGFKITKHYALLRFDGDNMGQWLSKAKSKEEHQAFSRLLLDLADDISAFLNNGRGRTIYAGGDDFLGMVNLKSLFEVMTQINKKVEALRQSIPIQNGSKQFSVSFGIFISHYKVPLGKALEMSNQLLNETKTVFAESDKDGMGLAFFKKSGVIGKIIVKNRQLPLLEETFRAIRDEEFNSRIIYAFARDYTNWKIDHKYGGYEDFSAHRMLLESDFERRILKETKNQHRESVIKLSKSLCQNMIEGDVNEYRIDFSNLVHGIRILEAINADI